MKKRVVSSLIVLLISAFISGCGCGGGDERVLTSIEVSPANPSIAAGTSQQFKATGVFSDNTTLDLTESVSWNSSDTSVASVSNDPKSMGTAHALAAGKTVITATTGSVSGSTTLSVSGVALTTIEVTPADATIAANTSKQFKATGVFSDSSRQDITTSVQWSSSEQAVATISNEAASKGLAQSVAAGKTVITATSGSVSGSTTLTVSSVSLTSIAVTPANPTVQKGKSQQFTAIGTFTDKSTQDLTSSVTWSSSNPNVAIIGSSGSSAGVMTALADGTVTISAMKDGVTGSTTATIKSVVLVSIKVTPENPTANYNSTIQFHALGSYSDGSSKDITLAVTWSSSDPSIATISNAPGSEGLATTDHKTGTTIITATLGGISGSTKLLDP